MPKNLAEVLRNGARAARAVSGNTCATDAESKALQRTRLALLEIITHLAQGSTEDIVHVERAMQELHPRTNYCQAMLIREIADVCVTLNYLERGEERGENKSTDAGFCCGFLADEFSML